MVTVRCVSSNTRERDQKQYNSTSRKPLTRILDESCDHYSPKPPGQEVEVLLPLPSLAGCCPPCGATLK